MKAFLVLASFNLVGCFGTPLESIVPKELTAKETTWSGKTNNNWDESTNWSDGVPDETSKVIISDTCDFCDIKLSKDVLIYNLSFSSSYTGTIDLNGYSLHVLNNLSSSLGSKILTSCGTLKYKTHQPSHASVVQSLATPKISMSNVEVNEGQILRLRIELNELNCDEDVSFDLVLNDLTASIVSNDYSAPSSTTFIIPKKHKFIEVEISVPDDSIYELDEEFTVDVSNISGATAPDSPARILIKDNDLPPNISVADISLTEGQDAVFTISLDAASEQNTSFDWVLVAGTATAGSDYTDSSGSIIITAGETSAEIRIATTNDYPTADPGESFQLSISNVNNSAPSSLLATASLLDAEPSTLAIEPNSLSISNSSSFAFSAVGGTEPYTFNIVSGGLGSIDANGIYTAPGSGSHSLQVELKDSLGATSLADVTVQSTVSDLSLCTDNSAQITSGSIVDSGGTGGNYSADESCWMNISNPEGASFVISFSSFSLGAGDVLRLYDSNWNLIGAFDKDNPPSGSYSAGDYLSLNWSSDSTEEAAGFLMDITSDQTLGLQATGDFGAPIEGTPSIEAEWTVNLTGFGGVKPYSFEIISGEGSLQPDPYSPDRTMEFTAATTTGSSTVELTDGLGTKVSIDIDIVNTSISVASSSRSNGGPGDGLNLYGAGFHPDMKIYAGGTSCDSITVYSSTQAYCRMPNGSGLVSFKVENSVSEFAVLENAFTYNEGSWNLLANQPTQSGYRRAAANVWAGDRLLIWGGNDGSSSYSFGNYNDGFIFEPLTGTWSKMSASPLAKRGGPAYAWTGREMIIYGGLENGNSAPAVGAAYDPINGTWRSLATPPQTNFIHGRVGVWTGKEFYVFGGTWNSVSTSGMAYNPTTDSWRSIANMPDRRYWFDAIWTGEKIIMFGGRWGKGSGEYRRTGYAYDPESNSWTAIATPAEMRMKYSSDYLNTGTYMLWTGSHMLIAGGGSYDTGNHFGKYNPRTDTWESMSQIGTPYPNYLSRVAWTGTHAVYHAGSNNYLYDDENDVWAKLNGPNQYNSGAGVFQYTGSELYQCFGGSKTENFCESFDIGSHHNYLGSQAKDSWKDISSTNAMTEREGHSIDWNGKYILLFGGKNQSFTLNDGYRFDPHRNVWSSMSNTNAPASRYDHSSVWTGSKLFIFGGYNGSAYLNDAYLYEPEADTWTSVSSVGAPSARSNAKVVRIDHRIFVHGGANASGPLNDSYLYDTKTDTWTNVGLSSPPVADNNTKILYNGEYVVLFGGENNSAYIYDLVGDSWTAGSTTGAPGKLENFSMMLIKDKILIFGGSIAGAANSQAHWFNPSDQSWESVTVSVPSSREGAIARWTGSSVLIFGGKTAAGSYLNSGEQWNPYTGSINSISNTNAPTEGQWSGVWVGSIDYAHSYSNNATGNSANLVLLGGKTTGGLQLGLGAIYKPSVF